MTYTNEVVKPLEKLHKVFFDREDNTHLLDAIDEAGLLESLTRSGILPVYGYDEAYSSIEISHRDHTTQELVSILDESFIEHEPGKFYREDSLSFLGLDDVAEAMNDTYCAEGISNSKDFDDVLEGIRRHERAQDYKLQLEQIASACRPQDEDLATPEQALEAKRARYGRAM